MAKEETKKSLDSKISMKGKKKKEKLKDNDYEEDEWDKEIDQILENMELSCLDNIELNGLDNMELDSLDSMEISENRENTSLFHVIDRNEGIYFFLKK